jgi:hypothetical protein
MEPRISGTSRSGNAMATASALGVALTLAAGDAIGRPNTHAPAISTWDPRASSVVVGLGRAVSGDGGFTHASYNANFSSSSGVLSAQFGAHYVTYKDTDDGPTARGFSAGGVALFTLPLSDRFDNGVPGSAFAFYLGVVPTALFSGQLNFISVPLVLGVGLPFSPSRSVTFRPWVELSPGLNFDTRIQEVSTDAAIESAMDGTLTREEVEELVEQGLRITRETTVGKRAGLSFAVHLGERVDVDMNLSIGAGHASAVGLGAALVFRWDALVPGVISDERRLERADCAAVESRFRACPAASRWLRGAALPPRGSAPPAAAPGPARPTRPAPPTGASAPRAGRPTTSPAVRRSPSGAPASPSYRSTPVPREAAPSTRKAPAPPAAQPLAPRAQPKKPSLDEFPPLQAAPPKSP